MRKYAILRLYTINQIFGEWIKRKDSINGSALVNVKYNTDRANDADGRGEDKTRAHEIHVKEKKTQKQEEQPLRDEKWYEVCLSIASESEESPPVDLPAEHQLPHIKAFICELNSNLYIFTRRIICKLCVVDNRREMKESGVTKR